MAHETARRCAFTTDRLVVGEWHDLSARVGLDLADVVAGVLDATTTASLPPEWHGEFDEQRARAWIDERDRESPTLVVVERHTGDAIGLLLLFEDPASDEAGRVDLRLGYVLAETAWGRGLATELVAGLVDWAESEAGVGSMSGGVAAGNRASASVLRKNGFAATEVRNGEQIFSRPCLGSDATAGSAGVTPPLRQRGPGPRQERESPRDP